MSRKASILLIIGLLSLLLMINVDYHHTALEVTSMPIETSLVADYTPHGPIVILNNNFSGWPGSGTSEEPYLISGLNITTNGKCIHVSNTDFYYVIEDCFLYNYNTSVNLPTVAIYSSNNSRVENCTIISGDESVNMQNSHNSNVTGNTLIGGLNALESPFVRITDNIVSMNSISANVSEGIKLRNSCDNGFVYNNTVEQQDLEFNKGIAVQSCDNVTVLENNVRNVNSLGVLVSSSNYTTLSNNTVTGCNSGVTIANSNFTIFEDNAVFECGYGVQISNSNNSTITGNGLHHQDTRGLEMISTNCTIYGNFIGFNDIVEAQDQIAGNFWDDGVSKGNYWSDYTGEGHYNISYAGGVDHYPKVFREPHITAPDTIRFEYGDTDKEISWSASGTVPQHYEVRRDSVVLMSDVLDGDSLVVPLDNLEVGVYVYTLTAQFKFLSTSADVTVIVEASATPTINLDNASGVHQIPIEITCSISDRSEISEAILSYTVDAIVWQNVTMTWNGSLLKWVGEIPAQTEDTVVGYKVYAQDAVGNWAVTAPRSFTVAPGTPDTAPPVILYLVAGGVVIIGFVFVLMKRR